MNPANATDAEHMRGTKALASMNGPLNSKIWDRAL